MRVFIASDDPTLAQQLRHALTKLGHEIPSHGTSAVDTAATQFQSLISRSGGASEIIFLVMSPSPAKALNALRDLRRLVPKKLIAVGSMSDPRLLLQTLREGAHEYIDEANLSAELDAAFERLRTDLSEEQRSAKAIALIGASGGCGCSTLAANAAVVLAKAHDRCILLDLNAEAGDLSPLLDLRPTYTLADLCRSTSRLDQSVLEGALISHQSGARLLAAPTSIADAKYVTPDAIQRIVAQAKELASVVLADFGRVLDRDTARALEGFDELVLVVRLDFTSLRNARRLVAFLQEVGVDSSRAKIVANRHRQPGEIPLQEATEALGLPITKLVSDDPKNVNRAINDGTPVVLQAPSARVAKEIHDVAMSFRSPVGR